MHKFLQNYREEDIMEAILQRLRSHSTTFLSTIS